MSSILFLNPWLGRLLLCKACQSRYYSRDLAQIRACKGKKISGYCVRKETTQKYKTVVGFPYSTVLRKHEGRKREWGDGWWCFSLPQCDILFLPEFFGLLFYFLFLFSQLILTLLYKEMYMLLQPLIPVFVLKGIFVYCYCINYHASTDQISIPCKTSGSFIH